MIAEAATVIERWKRDATERICAGSGRPVAKPGHLFGTCSVCGKTLTVHDGEPDRRAFRHQEPVSPGMTVWR